MSVFICVCVCVRAQNSHVKDRTAITISDWLPLPKSIKFGIGTSSFIANLLRVKSKNKVKD